jgi:Protein of unknown function (DUF2752)
MKPGEVSPPPLPRRSVVRPGRAALRSLALLIGLMVIACIALHFQFPLPPCPLREWTGVPCPFCGSTRTFAALARFDFAAALRLNPLVCVAACGASARWLLVLVCPEKPRARLRSLSARGAVWKWLLAVALAANWLYLYLHRPR